MIDIENIVFNTVATALRAQYLTEYPDLTVYGEYVPAPSSFPCVTVVEDDNYTYRRTQDEQLIEHNARVMYTVNIYTNNIVGKKGVAKKIADFVDLQMQNMKFTRTMRGQIPNEDRTIYRITMRYEAIVNRGRASGDDIVYQMYRQ